MSSTHPRWTLRPALALLALVLVGLAFVASTSTAGAAPGAKAVERLVVRGEDTVLDGPCAPSGCPFQLAGGKFRGTLGTGDYSGALTLDIADAFSNGEGGVCAPLRGTIVLGTGSPDRLELAVWTESCQDGAADPRTSSFTGLARFVVKHGTGAYAKATGYGIGSFIEDANDHERMTLIGRIARR
jgi:hypothetical protein